MLSVANKSLLMASIVVNVIMLNVVAPYVYLGQWQKIYDHNLEPYRCRYANPLHASFHPSLLLVSRRLLW
jgi:hypothetical protein